MVTTTQQRNTTDPVYEEMPGHGSTVASWSMFGIMFVGIVLSCVAFTIPNWILFWAGGVVVLIGIAVGIILKAAGYGVGGKHTKVHH